jgi:hypothetical protein
MHADKIGAKKRKTIFLDESSSFDFEPFVFLEIHRKSPHHRPSKDIPKIRV